jgi:hypothetical protein
MTHILFLENPASRKQLAVANVLQRAGTISMLPMRGWRAVDTRYQRLAVSQAYRHGSGIPKDSATGLRGKYGMSKYQHGSKTTPLNETKIKRQRCESRTEQYNHIA